MSRSQTAQPESRSEASAETPAQAPAPAGNGPAVPNHLSELKTLHVTALVELEGGARMPTNLVDVEPDPAKIRVGMHVEVVFDDVTDAITLPKFRPRR